MEGSLVVGARPTSTSCRGGWFVELGRGAGVAGREAGGRLETDLRAGTSPDGTGTEVGFAGERDSCEGAEDAAPCEPMLRAATSVSGIT